MARIDELRLMTKVARLYHERGLTQTAIAAQLNLSQATVSRLLKRAVQEQIVRTVISVPPGAFPELEEELQARYGLKDVLVVDCVMDEDPTRAIGAAAAYYLETTLNADEVIGISSWSGTLLAMVDALQPVRRAGDAQVVQILGGVGNPSAEVHAARLTGRLARLVNGTAHYLPAPGVVGTPESHAVLAADPYVAAAYALFDRLTLALVGIGALQPSELLARSGNVFTQAELALLQRQGAVGDVCLHFFAADGSPVITPLDSRVIGLTLAQLRRVPRSVGIAGGPRKRDAIRGALAGGWVNVLITDQHTAAALVA